MIGGGSFIVASILFGIGIGFDLPSFKVAAKWLGIVAVAIAFVPILFFIGFSIFEKLRKK